MFLLFLIPCNRVSITEREGLVVWVTEFQIVRKSHIKHLRYINLFNLNWICSSLICMMYLKNTGNLIKTYLEFWLVIYYCLVWKWKLWCLNEKINKNIIDSFLNVFFFRELSDLHLILIYIAFFFHFRVWDSSWPNFGRKHGALKKETSDGREWNRWRKHF